MDARDCNDLEELRVVMANGTRKFAHAEETVLAEPGAGGSWRVTCAAGVQKVDRQAPFVQLMDQWLGRLFHRCDRNLSEAKLFDLKADALLFGLPAAEVAFPYVLWLPIKSRGGVECALVLLKAEPWRPQTLSLLMPLSRAYGHAWEALEPKTGASVGRVLTAVGRRRVAIAAAVMASCAAFIPVPMSALAPAEVVAHKPTIVAAPIDGVIGDIHWPPGAMVQKDAPILSFVDVTLRNELELAKRNAAVARAKYFKAVQTATSSHKELQDVAIAKAELDVAKANLAYSEELLATSQIKASRTGLLIYSSTSDWIGRPVKTGERILEIGDPADTELRIEVPVSDALTLREGGDVALFLDGDPLQAIRARITSANYRPAPNAENQLVYRVHASFSDGVPRRIGLRGVARVSSGDVPLAFYLFRRPIAAIRQRFGL